MTRAFCVLTGALGVILTLALLRDTATVFAHAPYDPNEGWNAVFALRAMGGQPIYPSGWLVNNYPPLSFYIVGALGRLTGDVVIAGRLISLAAFLATASGIAATACRLGSGRLPAYFATLFFAAALLLASDYVAMDDPQLLGHALQIGAFLLLLSRKPTASGLLFAVSLFVKHNLIALPLAAAVYLLLRDRGAAGRFIGAGLIAGFAGLLAFYAVTGQSLIAQLASPRLVSLENFRNIMLQFLTWAGVPLVLILLTGARQHKAGFFVFLYLIFACLTGMLFAPGDGVDANIFFDTAIAMALALALALEGLSQTRAASLAALAVAPLLILGIVNFHDGNFAYTASFRAESAHDIAFIKSRRGPALCEMLSLCSWAGKEAAVDVFNSGEAIRSGRRDEAPLAQAIAARHFAVLQFDQLAPFALGPRVKAALYGAYRLDHADDNGVFFVPRPG